MASSKVSILDIINHQINIETLPCDAAVKLFREIWRGTDISNEENTLSEFIENELGCHALTIVLVAGLGEGFSLDDIIEQWREMGTEFVCRVLV